MDARREGPVPTDLIRPAQAVRLVPGRKPGKAIHLSTLYRFLDRGWLAGYWVGGTLFVSAGELRQLVRVRAAKAPRAQPGRPGMTKAQQERFTREVLGRHGMG